MRTHWGPLYGFRLKMVLFSIGALCSGQVISDRKIDFFDVDSRSKASGDKLPSVECSRALHLQIQEEARHDCVVPTVTLAANAAHKAMLDKQRLMLRAGVLRSPVCGNSVTQEAWI